MINDSDKKALAKAVLMELLAEGGQSVIIDDVTGDVIHAGGPGFKYGPHRGDLP